MPVQLKRWLLLLLLHDLHRRGRRRRRRGDSARQQRRSTEPSRIAGDATYGTSDGVPPLLLLRVWMLRITAATGTLFCARFAERDTRVVRVRVRLRVRVLLLLRLRQLMQRRTCCAHASLHRMPHAHSCPRRHRASPCCNTPAR